MKRKWKKSNYKEAVSTILTRSINIKEKLLVPSALGPRSTENPSGLALGPQALKTARGSRSL